MNVARHWRARHERYTLAGRGGQAELATPQTAQALALSHTTNGTPVVYRQPEHLAPTAGIGIQGTVYSYTTVLNPPAGFEDQAPYVIALVKLADGALITAQLTDLEGEPTIGMPVEMVTRKLFSEGPSGMIVYGYKFRPVLVRTS